MRLQSAGHQVPRGLLSAAAPFSDERWPQGNRVSSELGIRN